MQRNLNMKTQTRRDFLQAMSLFSGSALFLGFPWMSGLSASEKKQPANSDKVRFALIGAGERGRHLTEHLLNNPEAQVVAVCDDYQLALERLHPLFQQHTLPEFYQDYRKMLERQDIDAVVIATPLHLHKEMALDSFQAGKHVMLEKSMAKTIPDCYEIVQQHKAAKRILFVGHQRLFNLVYLDAVRRVRAGEFGRVNRVNAFWYRNTDWRRPVPSFNMERRVNWRLYPEYSCGLMTEVASHQTQVSNWLLDEVPSRVCGSGSINYWRDGRQVYDNVSLVYTYPSGAHLRYDAMTSNGHYDLEEQIVTKEYTLELEKNQLYHENPDSPAAIIQLYDDMKQGLAEQVPALGDKNSQMWPNSKKGMPILDQHQLPSDTALLLQAMIQAVKKNEQPEQIVEQAYYASVAALMGHEAMVNNTIVTMPKTYKIE